VYITSSVSSESNYDWAHVYVNGSQKWRKSGSGSFSSSYTLTDGQQVRFRYTKDGSVNSGDDRQYYSIYYVGASDPPDSSLSNPGKGAYTRGDFSLTKGEVIYIAVGQRGTTTTEGAGGGGGSFVVKKSGAGIANAVVNDILLIAGGGAGAPHDNQPGSAGHGIHTTSGSGGGGASASGNDNELAAGGGGFIGNGSSTGTANGGLSFINGLTGGSGTNSTGGFGGGGSQFSDGSGGGGGYTGGAGEDGSSFSTTVGGGYSYNTGTNTTGTTGSRSGHGEVIIEQIQVPVSDQVIQYTKDSYLLFGTRYNLSESGTAEIEDLRIHSNTLNQTELNYVYRHSINVQEGIAY